jgi:sporulation protein YlmC with PRC-barrel domain
MANELNGKNRNHRLFRLHELENYEVADGDPDVRGWEVVAEDGKKIGNVDDLIVDPEQMKVRYLDIKTDHELAVGEGERHLLVPIGAAQIDAEDDEIKLDGLNRSTLEKYPVFKGGPVTYDYEMTLRETLGGLRGNKPDIVDEAGIDFYQDNIYNEDRFYTRRNKSRS